MRNKSTSTETMIRQATNAQLREVIRTFSNKPEWAKEVALAKEVLSNRQATLAYKRYWALHTF